MCEVYLNIDIFLLICEILNDRKDHKTVACLCVAIPTLITIITYYKHISLIKLEIEFFINKKKACQIVTKKNLLKYCKNSNFNNLHDFYEINYLSKYCEQPFAINFIKNKLQF